MSVFLSERLHEESKRAFASIRTERNREKKLRIADNYFNLVDSIFQNQNLSPCIVTLNDLAEKQMVLYGKKPQDFYVCFFSLKELLRKRSAESLYLLFTYWRITKATKDLKRLIASIIDYIQTYFDDFDHDPDMHLYYPTDGLINIKKLAVISHWLEHISFHSVGLFGHAGDDEVWTEGAKEMLDDMHKRKIDMADEIFVINVGGYIGSSTRYEIEYAETAGKPVRYLESGEDSFIPDVNLDETIAKLKKREKDIRTYFEIMQMADDLNDPAFQKKYDAFNRVRRNKAWRTEYFELMADFRKRSNPTFGEILLRLQQKTGQIEASFSSKMLATLDADMPIWDSNVLKVLDLKLTGNTTELKMSNAVVLYDRICRWYKAFLQTENAQNMIRRFDTEFPEFKAMSVTKKIDFILWSNV